jgi:hypothetical protein
MLEVSLNANGFLFLFLKVLNVRFTAKLKRGA